MFAHQARTRRTESRTVREEAAALAARRPHPDHLSNGEELLYRRADGQLSYIANYSKSLPHNKFGEVVAAEYRKLLRALDSRDPDDFERIKLGLLPQSKSRPLTNPQAGLAFDLEGPDAQAVTMPPAPRIDEPENSAEMGELYWMALCRDVAFRDYGTGLNTDLASITTDAATSLSTSPIVAGGEFTQFTGPKIEDTVTASATSGPYVPATLFRGFTPGDLIGPYLSQFLLKGTATLGLPQQPDQGYIDYGTLRIDQRQRTVLSPSAGGQNWMTTFPDWLAIQRGRDDQGLDTFDDERRFIRNLRDLANYVHFDALYEAYLNACLLMLNMRVRLDPGNPYIDSRTQDGFGTFGDPHILTLVTEVATRALKAVWFQKWGVHRRLRPEAFGGRIEVHRPGGKDPGRYPMIDAEILNSGVLARVISTIGLGTALLPQVFPEGSPTHPAYGAGHATVAGACVTILKAWFDESEVFDPAAVPSPFPPSPLNVARFEQMKENRRPKVPNRENETGPGTPSGTELLDYVPPPGEPPLTVGGELNKLAANISIGRNAAGVHWRSDYTESVRLGEEIAIGLLQEQKLTYNEPHHLSLTRFDGKAITI